MLYLLWWCMLQETSTPARLRSLGRPWPACQWDDHQAVLMPGIHHFWQLLHLGWTDTIGILVLRQLFRLGVGCRSACFWWECQWRSWKRMGLGWGYAHFFSSLLSPLIIIYLCKLCMKHVLFPSTNEDTSENISPTFHSSCWYVAFTFHLLSVWLKSIPLGAFQTIQYNHPLISNYTWNHDSTLFFIVKYLHHPRS